MQQIFSYISAHWMEGAIWLLGLGWGYLVKKVTEYKTIKDGLLAIMHDRLYQACTYYSQQGWINASGLKNLEYLYQSYHALGGNGTGTELYNRAKALPSAIKCKPAREKGPDYDRTHLQRTHHLRRHHCPHRLPAAGPDQSGAVCTGQASAAHREPDRGAAGHRRYHHRGRAGRVVEEQQLHPCSPSGRSDLRQAEGTGK